MRRSLPLLCLLFAGCTASGATSTPPAGAPSRIIPTGDGAQVFLEQETQRITLTLDAPLPRVWAELPGVYEALNVPLVLIESDAHRLGNRSFPLPRRIGGESLSRYLDCGLGVMGAPVVSTYRVTGSLVTALREAQGGTTEIETTFAASARDSGTSSNAVPCRTTRRLEARIVELLTQRLQAPAAPAGQ